MVNRTYTPGLPIEPPTADKKTTGVGFATDPNRVPRGGRVVALFGNSVTLQNVQRATGLWNTAAFGPMEWANCMTGGRYHFVNFGVGGEKTFEFLTRIDAMLASDPDEVWMDSPFINDIQTSQDFDTISAPAMTAILERCRGRLVRITTESFLDSYDTAVEKDLLAKANAWIRALPRTYRNVVVHDVAKAWDNPEQSGATPVQTQGFASDGLGVHPNDLGAQQRARAFIDGMLHAAPEVDLGGFNDFSWMCENPRAAGSNANGANGAIIVAPNTGVIPDRWVLNRTGSGVGTGSKIAHPNEQYRRGTIPQVVCNFTADNDTVTFGPRTMNYGTTVTDGLAVGLDGTYAPAIANGRFYRCIVAGTVANPVNSHLWSTHMGATFVSGTATFMVVEAFYPGTVVEVVGDVLILNKTGDAHIELVGSILGGGNQSCSCLIANQPNANTRYAWLPPRLTYRNRDIVLQPGGTSISIQVRVRGSAGGSVTIAVPLLGVRKQP